MLEARGTLRAEQKEHRQQVERVARRSMPSFGSLMGPQMDLRKVFCQVFWAIQVENPIEMIDLMLERPGKETLRPDPNGSTSDVLTFHDDADRPPDIDGIRSDGESSCRWQTQRGFYRCLVVFICMAATMPPARFLQAAWSAARSALRARPFHRPVRPQRCCHRALPLPSQMPLVGRPGRV